MRRLLTLSLVLLLLSTLRAEAVITLVQAPAAVTGNNTTTITVTLSSTGANALLACAIGIARATVTLNGVADSSATAWTQGPTASDGTNGADIWYRGNAGSGVTSVTATFNANTSANNGQMACYEFAGVATSSFLGQIPTNTGSETDTTINLTVASFTPDSTTSVILVAGRISAVPTTNWAAGTGYTLGGNANRLGSEYKIRTGSGDETAPIDAVFGASGSRSWAEAVAEFKPAGAAATGTQTLPLLGVGPGQ
jgi:hypothetical protein